MYICFVYEKKLIFDLNRKLHLVNHLDNIRNSRSSRIEITLLSEMNNN